MWEIATNFTEVLGALLALLWGLAARWPGRVLVWSGLLAVVVQVVLVGLTWPTGWDYVSNRVVLALPLMLAPAALVVVVSLPRLEPRWPVHAAAVGALLDFYVVFVDRPAPPYTVNVIVLWAILLGATGLLWWRQGRIRALPVLAVVVVVLGGAVFYLQRASVLPDRLDMASMTNLDWGGGPVGTGHEHAMRNVTDLTGPSGRPDAAFTLVAQEKRITLSSGATVDAWTFNGQVPGPELRVRQGDLVQVTLVNHLKSEGVTVHWHGLDVPDAEDGVAGVTQDAVRPGGTYVYRFRATQAGSFWYHTHQDSYLAVDRGLFGPLTVLPPEATGLDLPVMAHEWTTPQGVRTAFGTSDTQRRVAVAPGTPVRLRLINTSDNTVWGAADKDPRTFVLTGTPFTVAAIDGTDLVGPTPLRDVRLPMGVGGRYDLTFTMPGHPVRLTDLADPGGGLLLGEGPAPAVRSDLPDFDPAGYGAGVRSPFKAFDRRFKLILDDGPAFYDGSLSFPSTINNLLFPDTPTLMVREGDAVETTFVNRGHNDHPMHLHGHHALVLSRNGEPVRSWWTDSLEILPGQTYTVAFHADNPGVWMDHCHNLKHAFQGMVMHLAYEGVHSPFQVGHKTINRPE